MAIETFPVEAGHIMMFARAVGDANKIYYDEAYAKPRKLVDHRSTNVCAGEHNRS